jgi:hypothetical protein
MSLSLLKMENKISKSGTFLNAHFWYIFKCPLTELAPLPVNLSAVLKHSCASPFSEPGSGKGGSMGIFIRH